MLVQFLIIMNSKCHFEPKMPKNCQKIMFIRFLQNLLVINTIHCCHVMLLLMLGIQKVTFNKKSILGGQNIKIINPKMPKNCQKISFIKFLPNLLVINTIHCCHVMLLLMLSIQKVHLN